jgi:hypothetical protein
MLLNHNIPFNESRSIGRVQRGQPLKHDGGRATVDRDRERAASSVHWGVDPLEAGGSLAGHALMVCICNSRLLYIHVCVTSIFCICICICICACSPGSAQDPLQDRLKRGPDSYGLPKICAVRGYIRAPRAPRKIKSQMRFLVHRPDPQQYAGHARSHNPGAPAASRCACHRGTHAHAHPREHFRFRRHRPRSHRPRRPPRANANGPGASLVKVGVPCLFCKPTGGTGPEHDPAQAPVQARVADAKSDGPSRAAGGGLFVRLPVIACPSQVYFEFVFVFVFPCQPCPGDNIYKQTTDSAVGFLRNQSVQAVLTSARRRQHASLAPRRNAPSRLLVVSVASRATARGAAARASHRAARSAPPLRPQSGTEIQIQIQIQIQNIFVTQVKPATTPKRVAAAHPFHGITERPSHHHAHLTAHKERLVNSTQCLRLLRADTSMPADALPHAPSAPQPYIYPQRAAPAVQKKKTPLTCEYPGRTESKSVDISAQRTFTVDAP